jgi:hypothetical protein
MKEMFTFQNFPMLIVIALIVISYLSFFSVLLGS